MFQSLKRYLKKHPQIINFYKNFIKFPNVIKYGKTKGISIIVNTDYLDFIQSDNMIRISIRHSIYSHDIINSFQYYFNSVEPLNYNGYNLVDYSTSRYHDVIGYNKHPIFFSSFAEPIITTNQYLDFANLKPNSVVLDLGAYSGLTSILFKNIVEYDGKVIAVEADDNNINAINKNFKIYEDLTKNKINLLSGAVWSNDDGLVFSNEGNMGSSAISIVGINRGNIKNVNSYKLSTIAQKFNLEKIDFIKCDIEGGESVIFEDTAFFETFKPRIIVEPHYMGNKTTTEKVMNDLKKFDYTFKLIEQKGVDLPLIECYPPNE